MAKMQDKELAALLGALTCDPNVFRARGAGARVITIDEFNTSKTCHVCGDVLQGVVDSTKNFLRGAPAGAADRGLKHCARSTCSSFLDRDVNAALNILKALLAQLRGVPRPIHLQRDSVLTHPACSVFVVRRPVRGTGV